MMISVPPNIKNWWENLLDRERRIISVGALIVGVLLVYGLIWNPLATAAMDAKTRIHTQQALLRYLQHSASRIATLKSQGLVMSETGSVDLLALSEQTLSASQLSSYLTQVQQPQNHTVTLTFSAVPFDKLIQWLQQLCMSHGVRVTQFSATRLTVIGEANVVVTMKD